MTLHDKIKEFGGMGGRVQVIRPGSFRACIWDFGPNTIAAGDGDTEEEALTNLRKVKYGYTLRFDFLRNMPEERKQQIVTWFATLSIDQLEMVADFVEAARV